MSTTFFTIKNTVCLKRQHKKIGRDQNTASLAQIQEAEITESPVVPLVSQLRQRVPEHTNTNRFHNWLDVSNQA